MDAGIKLVQTRRLRETPAGTKIIIHLRKPDIPITDEFTKFIAGVYNQVAAGMIQLLESDMNREPTDGEQGQTAGKT